MVETSSRTQELIAKANDLKVEGNNYFKTGQYQEAIKRYAKISLYLNGLVSKNDSLAMYSRNLVTDEEKVLVDELKHSANSNMAAAYLELKNYQKVIQKASIALEIKESSKAFYRRAVAYIELGDIDLATNDLEKAKEGNINDPQIIKAEQMLQVKKFEFMNLEKKKYRGFFDKLNNE